MATAEERAKKGYRGTLGERLGLPKTAEFGRKVATGTVELGRKTITKAGDIYTGYQVDPLGRVPGMEEGITGLTRKPDVDKPKARKKTVTSLVGFKPTKEERVASPEPEKGVGAAGGEGAPVETKVIYPEDAAWNAYIRGHAAFPGREEDTVTPMSGAGLPMEMMTPEPEKPREFGIPVEYHELRQKAQDARRSARFAAGSLFSSQRREAPAYLKEAEGFDADAEAILNATAAAHGLTSEEYRAEIEAVTERPEGVKSLAEAERARTEADIARGLVPAREKLIGAQTEQALAGAEGARAIARGLAPDYETKIKDELAKELIKASKTTGKTSDERYEEARNKIITNPAFAIDPIAQKRALDMLDTEYGLDIEPTEDTIVRNIRAANPGISEAEARQMAREALEEYRSQEG